MAEGKTWASVSVHTREVGEAGVIQPEGQRPSLALSLGAKVDLNVWGPGTGGPFVKVSHDTGPGPGGATTVFMEPEQAREVIDALESALLMAELAEVEAEPGPVALGGAA